MSEVTFLQVRIEGEGQEVQLLNVAHIERIVPAPNGTYLIMTSGARHLIAETRESFVARFRSQVCVR